MVSLVSIVVPVYHSERTIKQCLDCITSLEFPRDKLEVIVVDDGSCDKTVDIVRNYPVKLIRKDHGGYPSSMNVGIKVANGDIIVIVDSDIYLITDWLNKVLGEFNHADVGAVSGYVATATTSSFWAKLAGYEAEDRLDKLKTKYVDHLTSTCTAYRKKLFENTGLFDEKLKRGSDENLAHRAFKNGWKLVFRKDAVCYHCWRSSLKSYFMQQLREGKYAAINICEFPELLLGKWTQPISLYIPVISMLLLLFTPIYLLLGYASFSLLLSLILILYHLPSAARIIAKHKDWTMLAFPLAINVRYVAWLFGLALGAIGSIVRT